MAKRLLDLIGASLGLLLLAPFLLAIAVFVKLDSPGPVIFRQVRIGRGGIPFRIHKFRTMVADAPERGPQITRGGDPRITRIGRFLRRYKLDELPQLIDVLQGSMSLVGPRPEVPRYVDEYPAELRDLVLSVRPGMTDPASVEFIDENELLAATPDPEREYIERIMPRKLSRYVEYVESRSLCVDFRILCTTVARILRRSQG